jgi:hypothetical protein
MPAIDLTRLKSQSAKLVDLYDQPVNFIVNFKEILEYYTNLTIRANQVTLRKELQSYNTPTPVIQQIINDLGKLANQNPVGAVNLTMALWKASFYESRFLAAHILGTIPPAMALSLFTRLPEWLYETNDQTIKTALLTFGLRRLRKENAKVLTQLISGWLNAPGPKTQIWGLHALIPLIQQVGYDDIPPIFEILRPAIEMVSSSTQVDIQACINALDSISPVETSHYLTEILQESKNPQLKRIFLRLLRGFSPELQKELTVVLK